MLTIIEVLNQLIPNNEAWCMTCVDVSDLRLSQISVQFLFDPPVYRPHTTIQVLHTYLHAGILVCGVYDCTLVARCGFVFILCC